jgi:hypothetical protein
MPGLGARGFPTKWAAAKLAMEMMGRRSFILIDAEKFLASLVMFVEEKGGKASALCSFQTRMNSSSLRRRCILPANITGRLEGIRYSSDP